MKFVPLTLSWGLSINTNPSQKNKILADLPIEVPHMYFTRAKAYSPWPLSLRFYKYWRYWRPISHSLKVCNNQKLLKCFEINIYFKNFCICVECALKIWDRVKDYKCHGSKMGEKDKRGRFKCFLETSQHLEVVWKWLPRQASRGHSQP